jgi:crotonobetainyl-CoA:carnitine CoA-transferase CaiB-like acyl-CoA transferase
VVSVMKQARVPSGPILSTADIMAEQQFQQRGMFQQAAAPGSKQQVRVQGCALL